MLDGHFLCEYKLCVVRVFVFVFVFVLVLFGFVVWCVLLCVRCHGLCVQCGLAVHGVCVCPTFLATTQHCIVGSTRFILTYSTNLMWTKRGNNLLEI